MKSSGLLPPVPTGWPTATFRSMTTPSTGARTTVWSSSCCASSSAAWRAADGGLGIGQLGVGDVERGLGGADGAVGTLGPCLRAGDGGVGRLGGGLRVLHLGPGGVTGRSEILHALEVPRRIGGIELGMLQVGLRACDARLGVGELALGAPHLAVGNVDTALGDRDIGLRQPQPRLAAGALEAGQDLPGLDLAVVVDVDLANDARRLGDHRHDAEGVDRSGCHHLRDHIAPIDRRQSIPRRAGLRRDKKIAAGAKKDDGGEREKHPSHLRMLRRLE